MSDRIVVYKTPLQRFAEIVATLLITAGFVALSHAILPDFSVAPALIISLIAGYMLMSWLGSVVTRRLGGAEMTETERSRRYLNEMLPGGSLFKSLAPAPVRRDRGGRTLG